MLPWWGCRFKLDVVMGRRQCQTHILPDPNPGERLCASLSLLVEKSHQFSPAPVGSMLKDQLGRPPELRVESADFKKGGWSPGKSSSYRKGNGDQNQGCRDSGVLPGLEGESDPLERKMVVHP